MTEEEIANALENSDPFDYYEPFCEWIMKNYPESIYNSDALVGALEDGFKFEEFLRSRP